MPASIEASTAAPLFPRDYAKSFGGAGFGLTRRLKIS